MDFFIKYEINPISNFSKTFCKEFDFAEPIINNLYIQKLDHLDYVEVENKGISYIAIGDVIKSKEENNEVDLFKGIFYLLSLSIDNSELIIKSDTHSLLPVYYFKQDSFIFISSSIQSLVKYLRNKEQSKTFYAELAILYSQIDGSTFFKEIKRLEYGEVIKLNNLFSVIKEKRFYDYFTGKPKKYKESINDIADLFISTSKLYVDEPCAISLTGGFDGRTITACAHYHKSNYSNFSYGRMGNGDVDNPIHVAKELNLNYKLIELEDGYIKNKYLKSVRTYLELSGGLNGFQYPQSAYYTDELKKDHKIIVTGYLGSEILANAKGVDDEVNPWSVIDYITNELNKENYAYSLESKLIELELIENRDTISNVIKSLDRYFADLPNKLTKNQQFAVFSFENIYRNTFGIWIYIAMHNVKIRVPFLDKDFFTAICKTEVSQFYREFLETNQLKRIKGQLLYPTIIGKTWVELNKINSSKNYPPEYISSNYGRFRLILSRIFAARKYEDLHGLDKMSSLTGAINYIEANKDVECFKNDDRLISLMKENSLMRLLVFLTFSKIEYNRIINN